ncbi:hypothetical protein CVT26_012671 [Gymnopilus dilepis]|uniref:F-box domain-containing protein n=1 Tax=Gymnopilus dilepis TaxID=231916 RepID=A0A409WY16_9AGAR|nr:hypothetical protein CVT26_012671 [Gymnopilus dilepis]
MSITSAPPELISLIAKHLPVPAKAALLKTCQPLFRLMAPILYRRIKVVGRTANLLSLTLLSPTNMNYGALIRSVEFVGRPGHDMYATYPLFLDALSTLQSLREISFTIPRSHAPFFTTLIKTKDLVRETPTPFAVAEMVITGREATSEQLLPNLAVLTIEGDPSLSIIAKSRKIETLTVRFPVRARNISALMDNIRCDCLLTLNLSLSINNSDELLVIFYFLATTCSVLLFLDIDTGLFNALDISKALSLGGTFTSQIRKIALNARSRHPPAFNITMTTAYAKQRGHLNKSSVSLPRLEVVTLGPIKWLRTTLSGEIRWRSRYFEENTTTPSTNIITDFSCIFA